LPPGDTPLHRYTSASEHVRETCGASRSFEVGLPAHFFFENLLKLAIEEAQLRTDEPARIQAQVEERLGALEPDVEVLAVEIVGGGRSPTLRIFLDRSDGVDLELCTRATRHLRDLLREYTVEVSSPGPERPLTKVEHYRRFMGRNVRVRTREAIDGRREFKGELLGADDDGVALAGEWGTVTIPHERIRRSNLVAQAPASNRGRQK
jgi:ribosome maturation factor RimP